MTEWRFYPASEAADAPGNFALCEECGARFSSEVEGCPAHSGRTSGGVTMAVRRQTAPQIRDEVEAMPLPDLIKWLRNTPPSVVEATYRELGALDLDDGVIDLTE